MEIQSIQCSLTLLWACLMWAGFPKNGYYWASAEGSFYWGSAFKKLKEAGWTGETAGQWCIFRSLASDWFHRGLGCMSWPAQAVSAGHKGLGSLPVMSASHHPIGLQAFSDKLFHISQETISRKECSYELWAANTHSIWGWVHSLAKTIWAGHLKISALHRSIYIP